MVSSALDTLSIELCELFDRKLIFIASAVSMVICDGLSPPSLAIRSDFCSIVAAWRSSALPQAEAKASNQLPGASSWRMRAPVSGVLARVAMSAREMLSVMSNLLICVFRG